MKFTYNWLKDFVEIKIGARLLADKLTMAGLEVTSLEEKEGDFIFEVEVTSNRPDWLSVAGIAREVAAITNSKLKAQGSKVKVKSQSFKKSAQGLTIEIQDKKDCPLYTAKIIRDVKVGPSPEWLKKRLELIGCRSVNNIVDITNYVLFTYGEPLHAFDLDKLAPGEIIIRRAKDKEKLTTIDAQVRTLSPDILVIADKKMPVAAAGVMGGRDTEVGNLTKNILLEAAVFDPLVIRRSRRQLGLQSDSSYRFERGVDTGIVEQASATAAKLILELAGGELALSETAGGAKSKQKTIALSAAVVDKILGVKVGPQKIKKILLDLGFKVSVKTKNNFSVGIPSYRQDVSLEIDLIEEIARIYGYEFIPKTLPKVMPQVSMDSPTDRVNQIKNILAGLGLNEVITYSLIDKDLLSSFSGDVAVEAIEILNPLSQDQEILRPSLLPGLARCIAYNLNQKQEHINIFELAKVFLPIGATPREELVLGIGLCGVKSLLLEQGALKDEMGLLHLKGIAESLFERLNIRDYQLRPDMGIYVHQEKIGFMLKLGRRALDRVQIKNKDVFVLELSLDKLFAYARQEKRFTPAAKYPAVERDISFILKEDIPLKKVQELIREKAGSLLREIKVIDYYKGKQIPAGWRGITLACFYRADDRTLTEAEVNPLHNQICAALTQGLGISIR